MLEHSRLSLYDIIQLSENPHPDEKLYAMTFGEIQILNERLEKLAIQFQDDETLFGKLVLLKIRSSLIADWVKKRDQQYR